MKGIGLLAAVPEKGAPVKSSDRGAPSTENDPETMAAEDMLSAFQDGDAEALKAAFKRMYNCCSEMNKKEESDEGDYPSFT